MKSIRVLGALLVVAACVGLARAALATSKPARHHHRIAKVHSARTAQRANHASVATRSNEPVGDTDTIQSGDQSTPDRPGEQSTESESGADNEAGPGEPAVGHEDPSDQASHECTGTCQE